MKTSKEAALRIALVFAGLNSLWVTVVNLYTDSVFRGPGEYNWLEVAADLVQVIPITLVIFLMLWNELIARERIATAHQVSEQRLANVLETATSAIIGLNRDHRIFLFNRGAERIFGYTPGEVEGQPLDPLIPKGLRAASRGQSDGTEAPELAGRIPEPRLVTGRRKDGSVFPAEVTFSKLTQNGNTIFTVILNDVSRRVAAEEALRKSFEELEVRVRERTDQLRQAYDELEMRNRELTTLLDITHDLPSTLDLQPLLEQILDQLRIVIDYTGAAIFVADNDHIAIVARRGSFTEENAPGFPAPLARMPGFQELLQKREPTVICDLEDDASNAHEFLAQIDAEMRITLGNSRAVLAVPLRTKERVLGLLRLDHIQPAHFTPRHARMALAIADQASIALENAQLYREAGKVAALEERQRLARELHDSVSQSIYGMVLNSRAAKELLTRAPKRAGEILDEICTLSESALVEMRSLIFRLRPEAMESEGLIVALSKLAEAINAQCSVEVHLDPCPEPPLSTDLKVSIYRICQEALWNTAKHAKARSATIHLSQSENQITLELSDDGIGFDRAGSFPGHMGLQSMRERASSLGGILGIESVPGCGTTIRARIPFAPADSLAPSPRPSNALLM